MGAALVEALLRAYPGAATEADPLTGMPPLQLVLCQGDDLLPVIEEVPALVAAIVAAAPESAAQEFDLPWRGDEWGADTVEDGVRRRLTKGDVVRLRPDADEEYTAAPYHLRREVLYEVTQIWAAENAGGADYWSYCNWGCRVRSLQGGEEGEELPECEYSREHCLTGDAVTHAFDGWLPLHASCTMGGEQHLGRQCLGVVQTLLRAHPEAAKVSNRERGMPFPLELALQAGAADDVVLALVDAHPAVVGQKGRNALHLVAAHARSAAVVRHVLAALGRTAAEAVDALGATPLRLLLGIDDGGGGEVKSGSIDGGAVAAVVGRDPRSTPQSKVRTDKLRVYLAV